MGNKWSKKKINAIKKRYGMNCFYCGAEPDDSSVKGFHVDHVIPSSKGGSNELWNLVPVCIKCNSQKCDYTIQEWRQVVLKKIHELRRYIRIIKNLDALLDGKEENDRPNNLG